MLDNFTEQMNFHGLAVKRSQRCLRGAAHNRKYLLSRKKIIVNLIELTPPFLYTASDEFKYPMLLSLKLSLRFGLPQGTSNHSTLEYNLLKLDRV